MRSQDLSSTSWEPGKPVVKVSLRRETWDSRGVNGVSPCPVLEAQETQMSEGKRRLMFLSSRDIKFILLPMFLFYSGPHWLEWCPPTRVKAILFPLSTNSNNNLFQKPLRKCRNNVLPAIWASFSPDKLTHKLIIKALL